MTGRGARRKTAGAIALLALLLALAACSGGGSDASAPSSTSSDRPTSTSTSTTVAPTSTEAPTSTTTEVPPPGPKPVEQLDGLRPYADGEGCRLVLARLNAPTFPRSVRDRFATGYSGYVSAAGVVDVTASSGADDADFDFYGFVTDRAASSLDQSTWFTLVERAQPAPGTPTFTVAFTRGDDGTFTCAPLGRRADG